VCRQTGARYGLLDPIWRSPATGGLLDLEWPSAFPIDAIARRPATMWRYREAIPILDESNIVSLGEGMTPIIEREFGGRRVLLKLDNRFASGSYKDRGAAVVVSHCLQAGIGSFVEDSSGNAGAAYAMYAAAAGLRCRIFAPASASPGKLLQVRVSGADLVRVPGTRQDTSDAAWAAAQTAYYASHAWNPFFFHGTKTFAFELAEQLGWRAPDGVVIPTGNGTLLLGAALGFEELRRAGVIDRAPKLFAVQAAACAPLATPAGALEPGQAGPTAAEGIAIPRPVRAEQCLEAVRSTGGRVLTVTEQEIISALRIAVRGGVFMEPTCAAAVAALPGLADVPGRLVLAVTGHGLKAPETIERLAGPG
jgi:threonine synthase